MTTPGGGHSRATTPDPVMAKMHYRHALEMQAMKRATLELREEKAILLAQNFRLHRELVHEQHSHRPAVPPSRERDSSVRPRPLLQLVRPG